MLTFHGGLPSRLYELSAGISRGSATSPALSALKYVQSTIMFPSRDASTYILLKLNQFLHAPSRIGPYMNILRVHVSLLRLLTGIRFPLACHVSNEG